MKAWTPKKIYWKD